MPAMRVAAIGRVGELAGSSRPEAAVRFIDGVSFQLMNVIRVATWNLDGYGSGAVARLPGQLEALQGHRGGRIGLDGGQGHHAPTRCVVLVVCVRDASLRVARSGCRCRVSLARTHLGGHKQPPVSLRLV